MATITMSQAKEIETAYKEVREISEQYPDVFARKHSDNSYYPIATVEYNNDGIQMYVHLDGVRATIRNVSYCLINNDGLIISGSGGLITVTISDE